VAGAPTNIVDHKNICQTSGTTVKIVVEVIFKVNLIMGEMIGKSM